MTLSIQQLARTIAKARHGTDAMWANYIGAAREAQREVVEACVAVANTCALEFSSDAKRKAAATVRARLRALLAQPDGGQE